MKRRGGETGGYTGDRANGAGGGEHVRETRTCKRICYFTVEWEQKPEEW